MGPMEWGWGQLENWATGGCGKGDSPLFARPSPKRGLSPFPHLQRRRYFFHQFGVDRNLDVVADSQAAGFEHLIPGQPEVTALDLGRRAESGTLAAPRIF